MILQDPMTSLNPVYTVGNQIAESIKLHQGLEDEAVNQEVISALRLLKIPAPEHRLDDYPFQMSGGMRQRVVGAIAMSCRPRLLIADEPTTALDATIQAQYIALFQDVQKTTNVSIIFITHDFGVVAKMCHRVGVMYAGRIAEIGSVQDVVLHAKHPYTHGLMGSIPAIGQDVDTLTQIEGSMPRLTEIPPGCSFNPRCPKVFDRCRIDRPDLMPVEDSFAACWLFGQNIQEEVAGE